MKHFVTKRAIETSSATDMSIKLSDLLHIEHFYKHCEKKMNNIYYMFHKVFLPTKFIKYHLTMSCENGPFDINGNNYYNYVTLSQSMLCGILA